MGTAPLLTLLFGLAAPPAGLGCNLTVGTEYNNAGNQLALGGYEATGLGRTAYVLRRGKDTVRAWSANGATLMSLTWRPAQAQTASLTCTQKLGTSRNPRTDSRPLLICMHQGTMRWGIGEVGFSAEGVTWSASARGFELRISAQSSTGFVAAWTEEHALSGNATTLEAGPGQRTTCWRL